MGMGRFGDLRLGLVLGRSIFWRGVVVSFPFGGFGFGWGWMLIWWE
jgi:hypothetical protein